jgi:hypothetical protein
MARRGKTGRVLDAELGRLNGVPRLLSAIVPTLIGSFRAPEKPLMQTLLS